MKTYFLSLSISDREDLAKKCGTTLGHLRNIAYGRICGESLAINLERESGGLVSCDSLRPDVDWQYIRGTSKTHRQASNTLGAFPDVSSA